jgi:hypothetical protein
MKAESREDKMLRVFLMASAGCVVITLLLAALGWTS